MSVDNVFSRLQSALDRIENSLQPPLSQETEVSIALREKIQFLEAKNSDLEDKLKYTDQKLASLQNKIENIIEGLK